MRRRKGRRQGREGGGDPPGKGGGALGAEPHSLADNDRESKAPRASFHTAPSTRGLGEGVCTHPLGLIFSLLSRRASTLPLVAPLYPLPPPM